jgi:hypothetical protein
MRFLKKIKVKGYNVKLGSFSYVNENNILFFNDVIISDNTSLSGIILGNSFLFYSNETGNFFYNIQEKIHVNLGTIIPQIMLSNDECIALNYNNDYSEKDIVIFDFKLNLYNVVEKNSKTTVRILNDKKVICQYGWNTLKSLSLESGEYLWEVNLDKYSTEKETIKIQSLIGIWDNKLIVQMNDSDTIVIIDLKKGEIVGEIRQMKSHFPKEGPWGFGWYYHLEGQYAYLLQQNRYLQIDLATQKVETLWIPENTNFNIQRVTYDEQYAYFMACDGYHVQTDILGVFDRKALKITWQYDKPIYSSQPPQSDGNKLYCLDNEGVLHIFSKRENE